MKQTRWVLLVTLVATAVVLAQDVRQARLMLQAAIAKEKIDGNLSAAVPLYEEAVKQAGRDQEFAPLALLELAKAYKRAARPADASRVYNRLVREFPASSPESRIGIRPVLGRTQSRS